MALDKLVDSTQLDADLASVANAIRAKSGGSSQLAFPAGFVSEIQAIPSGGARTLQKLAEYMVTETVAQIDITVTDQMRSCEVLYVELDALTHTEDWLYPVLNNYPVNSGGYGYTPKSTVNNTVLALAPVYAASTYSDHRVAFLGSGMSILTQRQTNAINSINLKLYASASVFQSGTVRIWGYV